MELEFIFSCQNLLSHIDDNTAIDTDVMMLGPVDVSDPEGCDFIEADLKTRFMPFLVFH
jgi:hypothetical protein